MATLVKTPSGTWKAVIRKTGWPTTAKTFRTKRDAEDWARRTEDEMVRGVYIQRGPSERMTVEAALQRYLAEVSPTKRPASAASDARHAKPLLKHLGKYSLAALTPEIIAKYRDERLAGLDRKDAKGRPAPKPRSPNTVRLDLALLGHLFTIAIKEWGVGLAYNPVQSIRRPAPGPGRDYRLNAEEMRRLLQAVDAPFKSDAWLDRTYRLGDRYALIRDYLLTQEPSRSQAAFGEAYRDQEHNVSYRSVDERSYSSISADFESPRSPARY